MMKTGISHDTWEEEAVQRVKWRGPLRKATSPVEEQRQQEYQRAHVRRHWAATSSSFQCNNCQRYCRSRAGLTAHMTACLRQASTQIQDSHLRQRRTAIIIIYFINFHPLSRRNLGLEEQQKLYANFAQGNSHPMLFHFSHTPIFWYLGVNF